MTGTLSGLSTDAVAALPAEHRPETAAALAGKPWSITGVAPVSVETVQALQM